MTIEDQIRDEKLQYDINREAPKISAISSGKIDWLVKKAKNDFKSNPYNNGKTLLDPKCYVNLKVKQGDLDQHKSSSPTDINYDVPLANLEGLPDKPPLQKSFQLFFF